MRKGILKPIHALLTLLLFAPLGLFAQTGGVTGTVTDETGEPLVGVTVLVQGTSIGAFTDDGGKYTFTSLEAGEVILTFSYVGYDKGEKKVAIEAGKTVKANFAMAPENKEMDDVVIIGYGTTRKRDLTGNIVKITSKDLNDIPGTSIDASLQGKAAGVQVIQGSGIAGSGAVVRVRGINSLSAGGDPLYVVDGIPITQDPFLNGDRGGQNNNPLASINPEDIESIEILKDAAATGIYGSRGANGVILITTKRGKTGKPVFNYNNRFTVSEPTRLPEMLNAREWVQLRQEAWENDGNVGQAPLPNGLSYQDIEGIDTDWVSQTVQTGFKHEHNLSVKGGSRKLQAYAGLGYMDAQSYLIGNSYERLTGRLNLDYKPIEQFRVSLSSSVSRGRNNRVSQAWEGSLGSALSTALPIYDVDAPNSFFGYPGNPITRRELIDWRTMEWRSINNLNIEARPIKDLTLTAAGNFDYMNLADNIYEDSLWDEANRIARAKEWLTDVQNWSVNGTAKYDFNLGENHDLYLLGGAEAQKSVSESEFTELTNVFRHIYLNPEANDNTDTIQTENPTQAWSFVSFFARTGYKLFDKYIFQGSARVDGSSRFGTNTRYGFFPSLAGAWIISEENFMAGITDKVNFVKLKASYGLTGSSAIPNYERFGTFSPLDNNVTYNNNSTIFPIRLANPNLSWETTTTVDAGIELGFLNDRITTELSVYNKLSKDVLVNTATQASTGFDRYYQNVGKIRNRGIEFQITSRNLVGKFKWRTDLNIAHNRNTVLDIGITSPDAIAGSGDTRVLIGYPAGVNYLVRVARIDDATGLPVFLDANGNETFDWAEENRVPVGNVLPDAVGSLTNTFEYKGFDLKIFWTYSIGGNIYDDAAKRQLGVMTDWNMRREILDRWNGPGSNATYPLLTLDPTTYGGMGSEWFYNTDQWLYDATYARLKNVTLGYTVPLNPEKKIGFRKIRIYFTGTNLLTFTKFPGLDPEIVRDHNGPQGRNLSPNVTYLTPPQETTLSLGLNFDF